MKISRQSGNKVILVMTALLTFCWANVSFAQDTEPRRWAQIPTGVNFAGIGYTETIFCGVGSLVISTACGAGLTLIAFLQINY